MRLMLRATDLGRRPTRTFQVTTRMLIVAPAHVPQVDRAGPVVGVLEVLGVQVPVHVERVVANL